MNDHLPCILCDVEQQELDKNFQYTRWAPLPTGCWGSTHLELFVCDPCLNLLSVDDKIKINGVR